MKAGDWVRFTKNPYDQGKKPWKHGVLPQLIPDWKEGLLVEYHTWEKIARILYEGEIIAIHASQVQLARRAPEDI